MAYIIETWEADFPRGEFRVKMIPVTTLAQAVPVYDALPKSGLARITLARTGTTVIWDLYRGASRDMALDAPQRSLEPVKPLPEKRRQAGG